MSFKKLRKRSQADRADVAQRLLEFFLIADLRCADCGEWHGDPEPFGIRNEDEWAARMDTEIHWIWANAKKVSDALPLLEDEWSSCCDAVGDMLRLAA